jgi:5-methylthioribose kinase
MVLLVARPDYPGADFVLKQARAQLRTRQTWFSDVERIWREADVLRICAALLNQQQRSFLASTPDMLFEDRENFLLAIVAAPRPHATWKDQLLEGQADSKVAAACGALLGTLHAESWGDEKIRAQIGDRTLFDQLRVDPYYRTLAAAHDQARRHVERVIDSLAAHPLALVHADFSPKNLLVYDGGMMMVDFETGHFGDPAFDLGFFLSHLMLKACLQAPRHAEYLELSERFRRAYDEIVAARVSAGEVARLWSRGVQNFALCGWARLDGKSPVEYLCDESRRERMRRLCRTVLDEGIETWGDVVSLARHRFGGA